MNAYGRHLITVLALLLLAPVAFAAVGELAWQTGADGAGVAEAHYSRVVDGDLLVAGERVVDNAHVMTLARFAPDGDLIWRRDYDARAATDVAEIGGRLMVTGMVGVQPGLLRLDEDGDLLATRVYEGDWDYGALWGLCDDGDGGAVAVGYVVSGGDKSAADLLSFRADRGPADKSGGEAALLILRVDADGDLIWRRTVSAAGQHVGWKVVRTTDGEFTISGLLETDDRDVSIVRVDADGEVLWTTRVGDAGDDNGGDLVALSGGRVMVCGSFADGANDVDAGLMTLSADGEVLSRVTVDLGDASRALGLLPGQADGWLLCGWTGPGWDDPDTRAFLAEVDEDGGLVQKKLLGDSGFHTLAGLGEDGDDGLLSGGTGDDDLWAVGVRTGGDAASVDADLRHAGPGVAPDCVPTPAGSDGTTLELGFSLTGDEVSALRASGAILRITAWDVDVELPTTLNGTSLPALPAGGACTRVFHYADVTSTLQTGWNTLRVDASEDDIVAGDLWLLPGAADGAVSATVTTAREVVSFEILKDDAPYDHVLIDVSRDGQVLRTGQPLNGAWSTSVPASGRFAYAVREQQDGGDVLASGEFDVDLDNLPPVVSAASASPALANNGGASTVRFEVTAADADGVASAAIDLGQLGGGWTDLALDGDVWVLDHVVSASVPIGSFTLPVRVFDALGARGDAQISLTVMGATSDDSDVITVCGFTLRASSAEETETGSGVWSLAGNVRLTHSSGLALSLDAAGAVTATLSPARIESDGETTLYADLGLLGRVTLFQGAFAVEADGGLSIDGAAQYLLDEAAGFLIDPETMSLELELGETPGLRVVTHAVFDAVDGIAGNDLPAAAAELFFGADGTLSGSLSSDVEGEPLAWDLRAGTLSIETADWSGDTIVLTDASFEFLAGTFDFDSRTSLTVPTLTITPEGIDADSVVIDDFSFSYGGFAFTVVRAGFSDAGFEAESGEVVFPLPTGDVVAVVEGLSIADGRVTLTGGGIAVPPLKIGSYDLGGVSAALGWEDGQGYLDASGRLSIPAFAVVDISFSLDSDCDYLLKEFCMAAELSGRGVPIGSTGFLLTDIGGCIADPTCGNEWIITFTAGVSSADRIVPPDLSVVQADVTLEVVPSPFKLAADGAVDLVGFPLGAAGFDLYTDRFSGWGSMQMPPALPMLYAEAATDIRWSPNFSFGGSADGEFVIPAEKLFFLDEDLQLAGFHAEIDDRGLRGVFFVPDPDDYFVEVSADFDWSGEVEFDYDLDWPFLKLDTRDATRYGVSRLVRVPADPAVDLDAWRRRDATTWVPVDSESRAPVPTLRDTVDTVTVPEDASPFIVTVHELPEGAGELDVSLVDPTGTAVDSLWCAEHAGFVRGRTADWHIYRVTAPAAGVWQVVVDGLDEGENYELQITWVDEAPLAVLSSPASDLSGPTDGVYAVTWSASDPEDDPLNVSLHAIAADPEAEDPGPWLLAADLPDSVSAFDWRPLGQAPGDYRLVLTVEDPYHPAARDTSTGVISLVDADAPDAVAGLTTRVGPNCVRLEWPESEDAGIRSYRLHWREQGALEETVFDMGRVTDHLVTGLQNGLPYEFSVSAYDVAGNEGPAGDPLTAAPDPLGDVTPPEVPTGLAVAAVDSAAGSASLVWDTVDDAVAYRVYYDRNAVAPYAGDDALEGASPILQTRTGGLTLSGLDAGVLYYATVSALDAAGNESALGDPVALQVDVAADADADGLSDAWERDYLGDLASDGSADPDGDGLDNRQEYEETGTHPGLADTDGDHVPDGVDPAPLDATDADGNELPDDWETHYGVSDPTADPDRDGLVNLDEFAAGAAPRDPDTDGDLVADGLEAGLGLDPTDPDSDDGGAWDGYELAVGGDPLDPRDDATESTDADQGAVPLRTGLGVPAPNPFNARLAIPYTLAADGHATVELYDVRGRRVRALLDEVRPAGIAEVRWDGRDDTGRDAASGVYFVRFAAEGVEAYRKVMLVK